MESAALCDRRRCRRQRHQDGRRRRRYRADRCPSACASRHRCRPRPIASAPTIGRLVRRLVKATAIPDDAPVGVGLPGVAIGGRLMTAANIDPEWVDYPIAEKLVEVPQAAGQHRQRRRRCRHRRDALRRRRRATRDGHLPDPRAPASAPACSSTACWSPTPSSGRWRSAVGRLNAGRRPRPGPRRACRGRRGPRTSTSTSQRIEDLMWPSLFILGGGVSKNADKFVPRLTTRTPVVPAELRNDAGIIGAAIVAADGFHGREDDLGRPARRGARRRAEPRGPGAAAAYHRPLAPRPSRHASRGPSMTTESSAPTGSEAPTAPAWSSAARPSTQPTARRSTSSTRPPARRSPRSRSVVARTSTGPWTRRERPSTTARAGRSGRPASAAGRLVQARRAHQEAQRRAGLAREPQRRQADHRRPAARSSARASCSTTTRVPRTRSSARRSRSRSPAST